MVWAAVKFNEKPILIVRDTGTEAIGAAAYQQVARTFFERLEVRHGQRNFHKRDDFWMQQDGLV